jgi:hypothetical protein
MKVTISKELLEKILGNFYKVCSMCDELDIYEHGELENSMQEMKEWTKERFGRKIDKLNYEY